MLATIAVLGQAGDQLKCLTYTVPYIFVSGSKGSPLGDPKTDLGFSISYAGDQIGNISDYLDRIFSYKLGNNESEIIKNRIELSKVIGKISTPPLNLGNEYESDRILKFYHTEQGFLDFFLKNKKDILKEISKLFPNNFEIIRFFALLSSKNDMCKVCGDSLYCACDKASQYLKFLKLDAPFSIQISALQKDKSFYIF